MSKDTDSHIAYHLVQARRYTRALADPMHAEYDSARKTAEYVAYHQSMADWYSVKPEPPHDTLAYTEVIEHVDKEDGLGNNSFSTRDGDERIGEDGRGKEQVTD